MVNEKCKTFLKFYRLEVNAKKIETINKRYHCSFGFLAPNNKYYNAHCGYCAEVEYLNDIRGLK